VVHSGLQVAYVAVGETAIREAAISAWSVKRHMPSIVTNVFADRPLECAYFDRVTVLEGLQAGMDVRRFAKLGKMHAILNCDSEYVLYLDADTYVLSDLSGLPAALQGDDIAAAFDSFRYHDMYQKFHPRMDVPKFPIWQSYYNTGVMLVRRNARTDSFLRDWSRLFRENSDYVLDQLAFHHALDGATIRIKALSPEFNVRPLPAQMCGKIHVMHGHESLDDWPRSLVFLADFLNSASTSRVYLPHDGRLVFMGEDFNYLERTLADHKPIAEREEFLRPEIHWDP